MAAITFGTTTILDGASAAKTVETYVDPNRANATGAVVAVILADGSLLAPGQALAPASLPVVLTAAQLAALTPTAGAALDGTDATGVTPPAGATGLRGWLSAIFARVPALVGGRVPVDSSGATQPVSATALPLPAGAATEATLAAQVVGCAGLATAQVTVDATAGGVVLCAARVGRRSVTVTNLGTADVFVGVGTVTAANGELLAGVKGSSQTYLYAGALKAIVASGTQAVSVREEYS